MRYLWDLDSSFLSRWWAPGYKRSDPALTNACWSLHAVEMWRKAPLRGRRAEEELKEAVRVQKSEAAAAAVVLGGPSLETTAHLSHALLLVEQCFVLKHYSVAR